MKPAGCHPERKYFAKGFCRQCYQKARYERVGRAAKVNECGHTERKHAALGMCQSCFAIHKRARQGEEGRKQRKDRELRSRYGISLAQFHQLYEAQGSACALCNRSIPRERDRHVDHCHDTGKVRGILCFTCNKGLGMLGDTAEGLRRALDYVCAKKGVFVLEQWEEAA